MFALHLNFVRVFLVSRVCLNMFFFAAKKRNIDRDSFFVGICLESCHSDVAGSPTRPFLYPIEVLMVRG